MQTCEIYCRKSINKKITSSRNWIWQRMCVHFWLPLSRVPLRFDSISFHSIPLAFTICMPRSWTLAAITGKRDECVTWARTLFLIILCVVCSSGLFIILFRFCTFHFILFAIDFIFIESLQFIKISFSANKYFVGIPKVLLHFALSLSWGAWVKWQLPKFPIKNQLICNWVGQESHSNWSLCAAEYQPFGNGLSNFLFRFLGQGILDILKIDGSDSINESLLLLKVCGSCLVSDCLWLLRFPVN